MILNKKQQAVYDEAFLKMDFVNTLRPIAMIVREQFISDARGWSEPGKKHFITLPMRRYVPTGNIFITYKTTDTKTTMTMELANETFDVVVKHHISPGELGSGTVFWTMSVMVYDFITQYRIRIAKKLRKERRALP